MNNKLTDDDIRRMRVAAANDQLVTIQLQDIADGYNIPKSCSCGWAAVATSRQDHWSGTWCLHCTANELANTPNAPDEL